MTITETIQNTPDIQYKDLIELLAGTIKKPIEFILTYPKYLLTKTDQAKFGKYLARYRKQEPIAYILGHKWFYGQKFQVDENVLIPRQETEQLVETALRKLKNLKTQNTRTADILEIGTGSGCISISILKTIEENPSDYPDTQILATDINPESLKVAKTNSKTLLDKPSQKKLTLAKANIIPSNLKQKFDLILSNPPYIPDEKMKTLPSSVKNYEPIVALKGGSDGLGIAREIVKKTTNLRKKSTKYIFELINGKILTASSPQF